MTDTPTIPAVSVAVVRANRVLLVKRGLAPSRGLYAFPGGRVEAGETNEQAARRELYEETRLVARDLSPLREFIIPSVRDGRTISYRLEVFLGHGASGEPQAGDDAEEAGFYTLAEMEALPVTPSVLEIARELLG